jgi:hypothetical protein
VGKNRWAFKASVSGFALEEPQEIIMNFPLNVGLAQFPRLKYFGILAGVRPFAGDTVDS